MSVLDVQITTTGIVPNTSGLGIGMTQQLPVQIYITTNDTLATVTTAGYLNASVSKFQYPYNNYQMALVYTTDAGCTWLRVTVTYSGATATYSLVTPTEGSGTFSTVLLGNGTAAAPSLAFTSDTGTGLYRASSHVLGFAANGSQAATLSATAFTMLGNLVAGSGTAGTAGTITSFPGTGSKGSLILAAVANTGNTNVTISNAAFGQATVMSFADVGAATGNFLDTGVALVSGNFPQNSGTAGLMVDSGLAVANIVAKNAVNTMAAASQIILDKGVGTESSNAVTINKQSGVITTTSLTTAGGATETITLTNSEVAATSVVVTSIGNGSNSATNAYTVTTTVTLHTVVFVITNLTAATALNGTLIINFAVF